MPLDRLSAAPLLRAMVPSVAMNELMPNPAISAAFKAPNAAPAATAARIAKGPEPVETSTMAETIPAAAVVPPTEMSMPRAMITPVMPNATIATIALC